MSHTFQQALASSADAAGVIIDDRAREQLEAYYELLRRWNQKISLTSLPLDGFQRATLDRLLIEAAIAAPLIDSGTRRVLDVGSGGGSPAIPLKILRPELRLTMTEARQKKVAFLREAVSSLSLSGVEVLEGRVEALNWQPSFDCVTLRAVRVDPALMRVIRAALVPHGQVVLFGSDTRLDQVLTEVERRILPGGSMLRSLRLPN